MAECRRLIGVSERLSAAAIVSVPLLVAASIMMNRPAILWAWLPIVLFIASVLFRNFAADALHKARSLRWSADATSPPK